MIKVLKWLSITATVVLIASAVALGYSSYLNSFNTRYGTAGSRLDTCDLCHIPPSKTVRNPYGVDYANDGHNFAAIDTLDSDNDGWTNIDEINSRSFPGDSLDFPTDVSPQNGVLPESHQLLTNYPNPFNSRTVIGFSLSKSTTVKLTIYDVLGRQVRALVNEFQTPGLKTVVWDGTDNRGQTVAAGVYFFRLKTDDSILTKKMVFLK